VVDVRGNLQLRLDNYYVLGGSEAATNERRLGLLPLLLHPDPTRVLFVGLATGVTASAGPALGVADTTVVELVPEVAQAARAHFAAWNGDLLARPDVRLVIDDGRRYLQASGERFDVVVSDLFVPWHAGTSSLYAREMYETVARRLAPDGLFCQWLPLYQLTREEFDVITRTFLAVFPNATLWRDDFYPNRPVVGLVGRMTAQPVDVVHAAERAAGLPTWGLDPLLAAPRGLAMLYAGDLAAVADDFAGAPINTDDRPLIEFLSPRLTRMGRTGDKDWFVGAALADFYDRLLARDPEVTAALEPPTEAVADARRAGRAMVRYALAQTNGDEVTATRFQTEVRSIVPDVVAAAGGSADADAGALRQSLGALRSEQDAVRHRLEAMERNLERLGVHEDATQ
jgi:spermidine synthase